ncbi:hypothetical protein FHX37_3258 [Haloactinospora alba]|uniref:Secreted protein n=1 Tax=Haloactinospora alba TaxID=405555 RepID=A0A543NN59_9ACTN|nr:hypothetical protein [Haloactinospora alba]TQN33253.1 hypothetical protein FHX37_3258 [Haloactinospora alba]
MKGSTARPDIADRHAARAVQRARAEGRMPETVGPRTTPSRIRILTLAALAAVAALFLVVTVSLSQARDGVNALGDSAGPRTIAAHDVYSALSDMEAQATTVLLMGDEHGLGRGRAEALRHYEQRRGDANHALAQAAQLASEGDADENDVRELMDGLGSYEQLVARARIHNDAAGEGAGALSGEALRRQREASTLMQEDLLPQASELMEDSRSAVTERYEDKRSAILSGAVWVVAAGAVATGILVWLHHYLSVRFRRRMNVPIAGAALAAAVLTLGPCAILVTEAQQLRTAKEDGLDPVLSLSQTRAVSTAIHADQNRYLLDPARGDVYEEEYLAGARRVLAVDAEGADGYADAVTRAVADGPDGVDASVGGFLGREARNPSTGSAESELAEVLEGYAAFQRSDQHLRGLVEDGRFRSAVEAHLDGKDSVSETFRSYDASVESLIASHRETFGDAVTAGERELAGRYWQVPAMAVAVGVLIVAGVYPRLAEYR